MMRFISFTGQFRYYWFAGVAAAAGCEEIESDMID